MKKLYFLIVSLFIYGGINAQCTPNATPCTNGQSVVTFGGLCDTTAMDGQVGVPYLDNIQFFIEGSCFDPNDIGVPPPIPGVTARITGLNSFTFNNLPGGMNGGTDQPSYTIPQNATVLGCGYFQGTPTQAGVFSCEIVITASYSTGGCYFFPQTGTESVPYNIALNIKPDASFSGLASSYCQSASPVSLTPVTSGGTFSGPGITGSTFSPVLAGPGTHDITYTVSAQQGTAIAPSTADSTYQVTVNATTTYYLDNDNDSYGDVNSTVSICSGSAPAGYVANSDDCDDNNMNINPGASEVCNGLDDNCDNDIDENLPLNTYYADTDNDQFGDVNSPISVCATSAPPGYVVDATDCDDNAAGINPGATDIPGNGIDEDCVNGDATVVIDNDNDTYPNTIDCDDNNPDINPGATEICNGIDDNCANGIDENLPQFTYYADTDNDTYGDLNNTLTTCATSPPAGYVVDSTDCNDNNVNINPGASEVCNGIDDNCDNDIDENLPQFTYYEDLDLDGFGVNNANAITSCSANPPAGFSSTDDDCNDNDIDINPGASEACNGVDDDCDGSIDNGLPLNTYFADLDGDGFGDANDSIEVCDNSAPNGYVSNNLDCDDSAGNINPNATEVCDGEDNDCDGDIDEGLTINEFYEDADADGFGATGSTPITSCSSNPPAGYANNDDDCDDSDDSINPGATEIDDDGIDQDCNPATGIRGQLADINLSVYPNPTNGLLNINFNKNTITKVELIDIKGQLIQVEQQTSNTGITMNISQLDNGIYILKFTKDTGAVGIYQVVKAN